MLETPEMHESIAICVDGDGSGLGRQHETEDRLHSRRRVGRRRGKTPGIRVKDLQSQLPYEAGRRNKVNCVRIEMVGLKEG